MIAMEPIGVISTPFTDPAGMPVQPAGSSGVSGTITLFDEYRAGLKDLEEFSHLILLYFFHRSQGYDLQIVPFLDTEIRGLFSTRAPKRPNPIGLSIVQLDRIEDGTLHIRNVDMLDGTPLLDIKPYVPKFDAHMNARAGWFDTSNLPSDLKSDRRFTPGQKS